MSKIFVSHRNGEQVVRDLIERLVGELGRADFEVLVDVETLEAGAGLRHEIFTWIGVCNAAIVILSPEALGAESVWVPMECSILSWRKTLNPDFILLPVFIGGVTAEDLRNHSRFRDLGLHDLLAITDFDPATICRQIGAAIIPLHRKANTPLEDLAEQIESLLDPVRPDFLDEVVSTLKTGDQRFPRSMRRAARAAVALLEAPLEDAVVALEYLIARTHNEAAVERILDVIAPGWVDLAAARWIAYCATAKPPRPAAVVNASTRFAADMYIRRASCRPPRTTWRMVTITGVFGEKSFEDLEVEIMEALHKEFPAALLEDPFDEARPDARLRKLLDKLHSSGRPVLIVLRHTKSLQDLLPLLQSNFSSLTFLLLSGDSLPHPDSCAPHLIRRVEPALAAGQEDAARLNYQAAVSAIRAHAS